MGCFEQEEPTSVQERPPQGDARLEAAAAGHLKSGTTLGSRRLGGFASAAVQGHSKRVTTVGETHRPCILRPGTGNRFAEKRVGVQVSAGGGRSLVVSPPGRSPPKNPRRFRESRTQTTTQTPNRIISQPDNQPHHHIHHHITTSPHHHTHHSAPPHSPRLTCPARSTCLPASILPLHLPACLAHNPPVPPTPKNRTTTPISPACFAHNAHYPQPLSSP